MVRTIREHVYHVRTAPKSHPNLLRLHEASLTYRLLLAYERYPNIRAALRERNGDETFRRLYRALDSFFTEIRSLPSKPSDNFESTLRPYAGEVKLAATALDNWASTTRTYAETQSKE